MVDRSSGGTGTLIYGMSSMNRTVNHSWVLTCNITADVTAWRRLISLHDQTKRPCHEGTIAADRPDDRGAPDDWWLRGFQANSHWRAFCCGTAKNVAPA